MMNTKGTVRDVMYIAIFLLAIGITFFIGGYISNTINTQLVNTPTMNTTEVTTALTSVNNSVEKFDYMFLAVFIGLLLAIIVTSWIASAFPIFMWIYFFILIFIVAITTIFSQVWTEFITRALFVTTLTNFPITNHIMTNLGTYMAIFGLIGILILFGKPYLKQDFGM